MPNRWWQYQHERFPIVSHGVLIGAFTVSALSVSTLLRGRVALPETGAVLAAFACALVLFLHLRIADEFKDHDHDVRFRPHLPVPRGLVALRELGWLAAAAAAVQLGLTYWVNPGLTLILIAVWIWLFLMTREFFVPEWLKARPLIYMLSHMLIMPLTAFYVAAFDWGVTGGPPPAGLAWFLAVGFFGGIVLEVGRKIRAPVDERPGGGTYSAAWGQRKAVLAWLGAMVLTLTCALPVAQRISFLGPMTALMAVVLGGTGLMAWRMLTRPEPARAKLLEHASGAGILCLYVALGPVPLLWRLQTVF